MNNTPYDFYSPLNQKLMDAAIAGISFYLAYQVRFDAHIPGDSAHQMWILLAPLMLGSVVTNILLGTYRMVWRYTSASDAATLARNHAAFCLVVVLLRYAPGLKISISTIPISVIVLYALACLLGSLAVRALRRVLFEGFSNHVDGTPVLLIGAGRAGVMVARELKSRADIRSLGFLDDDPKKNGAVICGLRVLGPLQVLGLCIQQYGAQEVIVCLARPPHDTLKRIWAVCEQLAVRVRIVPTLDEILSGRANIARFRDVDMNELLDRNTITISGDDKNITQSYAGKRILVTGAGGSIGAELAYQLEALKPKELVLLDKDENGLHDIYLRLKKEGNGIATPVVADIRFPQRLRSVFSDFMPEVIFHAAAHKHVHLMEVNPCEAIANNVVGTRTLVETALEFGVSRFIQISTDKAVNPTSIMGASKRLCEMIVQSSQDNGSRFCCVRFGNVLGSRGSVVPIFREQIAQGGPVTITHRDAQRFLMTIPEAVCLLIQAGTLANAGEIFVLDMGEPVYIERLARNLIEHLGLRPGKDIPIQITELLSGEKLNEVLVDRNTESLEATRFEKISMIRSAHFDRAEFIRKLAFLERASWSGSLEEVYDGLQDLNIGFCPGQRAPYFPASSLHNTQSIGA